LKVPNYISVKLYILLFQNSGHNSVNICLLNQEFNKRQLGSQKQTPIRFDLRTIKISFFRFKFGFNNTKMISTPWTLVCTLTIVWYFFRSSIKPSMEGGGEGGKVRKMQKNTKKGIPMVFWQFQVPPSKEFGQNPKDNPHPLWISNYCASITFFNVLSVSGIKTFHSHDTEL
jgi:hypothetical protein